MLPYLFVSEIATDKINARFIGKGKPRFALLLNIGLCIFLGRNISISGSLT
jgi:hypothetical protein